MTCVSGHLTGVEFPSDYKNWESPPPESLFSAPILTTVQHVRARSPRRRASRQLTRGNKDKRSIAQNLKDQAKFCRLLVIWTDCDREGEHIGQEIVDAAKAGNPRLQVKRAKFSNVERACVGVQTLRRRRERPADWPRQARRLGRAEAHGPRRQAGECRQRQNRAGPANRLCLYAIHHHEASEPGGAPGRRCL